MDLGVAIAELTAQLAGPAIVVERVLVAAEPVAHQGASPPGVQLGRDRAARQEVERAPVQRLGLQVGVGGARAVGEVCVDRAARSS